MADVVLGRPVRARRGRLLLLTAGVVLVVAAVSAGRAPVGPLLPTAALTVAVLALGALWRTQAAVLAAVAAVVVVPVYYGHYVVGTLAVTPVVAVSLVLLPAALDRLPTWRPVPLDLAVGAYVALRVLSYLLNYGSGPGAAAGVLLFIGLPYAVFRLCVDDALLTRLQPVVVWCGALLSVVAIRERMGVPNPFFTLLSPSYQGAFYARPNLRLGAVRGEASFGEPISFGMFLGLALVLGVHLALTARSRLEQAVYLALSGLLVVGLTTTQSRGALLVAAVGLLGYFLAQARRVSVLRIGALVGAALVVVLSTSVLSSVQRLVQSSSGQTREAASAEYRLQILEVVKDPEQFSLLGKVTEATGTQASADLTRRVGLKSIDSQYALVYLDGGVLCFVAFASVAGLVVATALRPTLRPAERAWAMGLAATFANLLTVALFTQEADLVWIGVAVLAGATQRAREGRAP